MASPSASLLVLLHGVPVGSLTLDKDERCHFRLMGSYKDAFPRPVLGQAFLDDLDGVWTSRARVPEWFSNLLPEGQLRDIVAKQAGVSPGREFFLLAHLGKDLPGAVSVVSDDLPSPDQDAAADQVAELADSAWHFSLAGVQLKFSAVRSGRGLTVPVSGVEGNWIVKLPDARYARVPENEFATMRWAAAVGIDVPENMLVDTGDIAGLPDVVRSLKETTAYAVRRFDRPAPGQRVHIEDFAQVLGLYPEQKYAKFNYETIAKVTAALTGREGLSQLILRLVFIIASGNGDAHHKNWSLIYPDQVHARLSPAYDQVSTIQYMSEDRLALNLSRTKQWQQVSVDSFSRLARKIEEDEAWMVDQVGAAVETVLTVWGQHKADLGYDRDGVAALDRHLAFIPLFRHSAFSRPLVSM